MKKKYKVIGLMSGTSLDGVDLAYVEFIKTGNKWKFKLFDAVTIPYTKAWKKKLQTLIKCSAKDYVKTDADLGHLFGQHINTFIRTKKLNPDFIASHGHTIFHQPEIGVTTQIGLGAAIAAKTGLPTICDFRNSDVAKGGQGAPLVPIGDKLLFAKFACCLNLGGIANISFEKKQSRIAFDICPVNMALNYLAGKAGHDFDKDGKMAAAGKINNLLLRQLNELAYYTKSYPKSLGFEWFEKHFKPILDRSSLNLADQQATVVEHICCQLELILNKNNLANQQKMLVTGGGAFHSFLIKRMKEKLKVQVIIPETELVNYKEALIFAFLGVLRWRNEINTLRSVTGSKLNSSAGAIYNP